MNILRRLRSILFRPLKLKYLLLSGAILIGTIALWSFLSGVEVSHHDLTQNALWPYREKVGLKVVIFSDLHLKYELVNDRLVKVIEQEKPDLCFFLGDMVTVQRDFTIEDELTKALSRVTALVPTYAVWGNHDREHRNALLSTYRNSGVRVLENERIALNIKGRHLDVVGLKSYLQKNSSLDQCFVKKGKSKPHPVLVLLHHPDEKGLITDYEWDLLLCGHTHGGQIYVPFIGAPHIPGDCRYVKGFYEWDKRLMYITRGLGDHYGIRVNCPREITVLDL